MRDRCNTERRGLQQVLRLGDAQVGEESLRRHTELCFESPPERALTHAGALGERRCRYLVIEVARYPVKQLAEFAGRCLRREEAAELLLVARALEKNQQAFRHLECQASGVVAFDQRQREVDTRRNTARRIDTAVLNEYPVGLDVYIGKSIPQLGGVHPVRRRAFAVKQAGGGQQQRTGTD